MSRLVPLLFAWLSVGCVTTAAAREPVVHLAPERSAPPPEPEAPLVESPEPPVVAPVLAVARGLVGGREVVVDGVRYRSDCSNFVRAVFLVAGHDLFAHAAEQRGDNGVRLIREYVARHGRLFDDLVPRAGDIVFFDDTYDRDGNGRIDDPLTHVGVVDLVEPDGTVWFIHRGGRGVVRDPMHLGRRSERATADGRVLNAWIRPLHKGDPADTRRLAGELFAGFGRLPGPSDRPLALGELEALLAALAVPPEP